MLANKLVIYSRDKYNSLLLLQNRISKTDTDWSQSNYGKLEHNLVLQLFWHTIKQYRLMKLFVFAKSGLIWFILQRLLILEKLILVWSCDKWNTKYLLPLGLNMNYLLYQLEYDALHFAISIESKCLLKWFLKNHHLTITTVEITACIKGK